MPFVPKGIALRRGEFYIPRLGYLEVPRRLPVPISQFIARFRELFDEEIYVPKRLDLSSFGDLAEYIHILVRTLETNEWTFERFAPACVECMGIDLTGAKISDARLAPFKLRLDERFARLARQEIPLYGRIRATMQHRILTVHWLFVPMSNTGQIITHCLLMSAYKGEKHHGHSQGTAKLGQYSEAVDN